MERVICDRWCNITSLLIDWCSASYPDLNIWPQPPHPALPGHGGHRRRRSGGVPLRAGQRGQHHQNHRAGRHGLGVRIRRPLPPDAGGGGHRDEGEVEGVLRLRRRGQPPDEENAGPVEFRRLQPGGVERRLDLRGHQGLPGAGVGLAGRGHLPPAGPEQLPGLVLLPPRRLVGGPGAPARVHRLDGRADHRLDADPLAVGREHHAGHRDHRHGHGCVV